MNWLDLVIVVCIVVGMIKGLFDGLIKQVVSLTALALAILFAGGLATLLQPILSLIKSIPIYMTYPICYVFSFILIIVLMSLAGKLLEKIWKLTPFGCLNNLAGGFVGMIITTLILSLLFNFMIVFDKNSHFISKQTKEESVLFEKVRIVVPFLYPYVRNKVQEGFMNHQKKEINKEEEGIFSI